MAKRQAYPDFSDPQQALRLVWDKLNALSDAAAAQVPLNTSAFVAAGRQVKTIPPLLGGGPLDADLTIRLPRELTALGYCVATMSASSVSLANKTVGIVSWGVEESDVGGLYDPLVPDIINLSIPGVWLVMGEVYWNINGVGGRQSTIREKIGAAGSRVIGISSVAAAPATPADPAGWLITCNPTIALALSDGTNRVRLEVYQDSGGALSYFKTRESFFAACLLCRL